MIVMKFGGSSVESGDALARLARIVKSRLDRKPVVVVSAMGRTTNVLLDLTTEAERGHSYAVWRQLKELQEYHLNEAQPLIHGESAEWLETSLRKHFRDLHLLMLEISDEGRELTPALRDEIVSYGERISSEVVTAVLQSAGVPSIHLDARQVIVTDDRHTQAGPLYWQTYAKLRRVIPRIGQGRVVVLGGFIGATETGATTTLGRGGSDLTASLVGAGISADEIQIWKDVDGILTCDPRIFRGVFRLKSVSYDEAAAMAQAGAKVLHPEAVTPAIRQRIPVIVRNSRRPEVEGTTIGASAPPCTNPVKSISAKQDLTVLEVKSPDPDGAEVFIASLRQLCARQGVATEFVARVDGTIYFAVKNTARFENLQPELQRCVEVHLRPNAAVITLVGAGIRSTGFASRVQAALGDLPCVLVSETNSKLAVSLIVSQTNLKKCVELLHREFFLTVDPSVFAETQPAVVVTPIAAAKTVPAVTREQRLRLLLTLPG